MDLPESKYCETVRDRFHASTRITPGCWLWTGTKRGRGYGRMTVGGKYASAHRVAYQLYCGDLADDMHVCHKCDNPSCVNPDHLFVGSHDDNMADKTTKGRAAMKLTAEQAKAIRAADGSLRAVAIEFGVNQSLVLQLRQRKIWKHV